MYPKAFGILQAAQLCYTMARLSNQRQMCSGITSQVKGMVEIALCTKQLLVLQCNCTWHGRAGVVDVQDEAVSTK